MSRYRGPVCKLCRAEGDKLYLKGERCYTPKCAFERRRNLRPGEHGARRKKITEYGIQLRAKQRAKRIYGVTENSFRNIYKKADKKQGITGTNLLQMLEMRLDNIVYYIGFAPSRNSARQFVLHKHILVNGKIVNIPSYQVKIGDVITVKEDSKGNKEIQESFMARVRVGQRSWMEIDENKMEGKILAVPTREEITVPVNEQSIIELYSK